MKHFQIGTGHARSAGMLFTRLMLGIIIFWQGSGKIFTWTVPKVYTMFFKDFERTFLPQWLIWSTAYFTSYVEFLGGFLLIIGLFRKYALVLLGTCLIIVAFGHGLMEPIWNLEHIFPRSIFFLILVMAPQEWDTLNVDALLAKYKKNLKSPLGSSAPV